MHQIRYVLASTGADEAAAHGHGYLELVAPVLVATTVAAIGISLLAALVGRVAAPLDPGHATERAAAYALGLLAVYFVQELAEGLLVGGHGALAGLVGPGGWLALPLAMAFGAVVALACSWLDRVQHKLAATARTSPSERRERFAAGPGSRAARSPYALSNSGSRGVRRRRSRRLRLAREAAGHGLRRFPSGRPGAVRRGYALWNREEWA